LTLLKSDPCAPSSPNFRLLSGAYAPSAPLSESAAVAPQGACVDALKISLAAAEDALARSASAPVEPDR
jgi:hypothetical protein